MNEQSESPEGAWACVERINEAWLTGHPERLADLFAPGIITFLPGFSGRIEGAEALIASFENFCNTCKLGAVTISDRQVAVVDRTAVVSFLFDMVYERERARYRSTGRDLWVLEKAGDDWRAVWRTMLDLTEEPHVPA